jgi:hypothetical protein
LKLQNVLVDEGRLSRTAVGPERRNVVSVRPEDDGLAIEQDAIDGQCAHRLRDSQKGVAVVGCVSTPQSDAARVLASEQSIAIEFNLVNPLRARAELAETESAGAS